MRRLRGHHKNRALEVAIQSTGRPWSRRQVLAAGLAQGVGFCALPSAGRAQALETTTDGVQVLRAQTAAPGPTFRARRGDELRVRLVNDSPEPTAIHWHGLRIANAMDGVPGLTQAPVAPGATFEYRFTPPDAGTFWYRPAVSMTGARMRGPSGALVVAETVPPATDQDTTLFLDRPAVAGAAPELAVRSNERLRLRLINAQSVPLRLRLDRHRALVMAMDGHPAEPFEARDSRLLLGPGNRMDLFVDATLEPGARAALVVEHDGADIPVLRMTYGSDPPVRGRPLPEPRPLPPNPLPARIDMRNALRATMPLEQRTPGRLFSVKRGRTVVLTLGNGTGVPCAVHLHGHHARLLDRFDDGWKPFWLDTVLVRPLDQALIAFVADNPGKWLLHGQPVVGDNSVMAWFEVT
jgi:FtsP/CotA-like multicopper oxidase with cupredoxin domain